jgi:hypothetical protein
MEKGKEYNIELRHTQKENMQASLLMTEKILLILLQ